jgi:SIR2-like domain/TIR domain
MATSEGIAADGTESSGAGNPPAPKIFINYRHSEAGGWSRLLYERLAARFGKENVFLDTVNLTPGTKWLADIRSHSSNAGVFISLIGPKWVRIMMERARSSEEDHVRAEIERALRKDSKVALIVPTLIDEAVPPLESDLPSMRSLWPLLHCQVAQLRPSRLDADLDELIERIQQAAATVEQEPAPVEEPRPSPPERTPRRQEQVAPAPDQYHYDELVRLMVEDGTVVPVLGPGANSSDRDEPWQDADSGYLPDAHELAAYLGNKLESVSTPADLAQVSQYLSIANGPGDLYRMLKRALPSRCAPSSVHRFLAGFPATLHSLGLPERRQLIVTTNYDDALERAFDEAEEPYDLAVYLASGDDKGKFIHVPHDGESQLVEVANQYSGFPMDEFSEVTRTVIMKIHGAADAARGAWHDNYVITEDDYIDYLTDSPPESIVPQQLLGKLKSDHLLFLGYTMRDWNLRVFLKRIFGQHLRNTSWAIQPDPDMLDSRFWKRIGVDLFEVPLHDYLDELGGHAGEVAAAGRA